MSVQAGPTEKRYAANGVTLIYTIPFLLIEAGDLQVYLNGVQVTSGFTLSGIGNPTSSITFAVAPLGDLLLVLNVPFQRLVDYQENGDFLATTVNRDFDRIWQALKQLFRYSGRVPTLGLNDIDGAGAYRAKGNLLSDLRDPVSAQDAATLGWAKTYFGTLVDTAIGNSNTTAGILYETGTLFDYLKTGVYRFVPSIAALKGLTSSRNQRAIVADYYASVRGGGGEWYVNPADTTSPGNGVTIIVADDGARWYRIFSEALTIQDAGADMTGVADSTAAVINFKALFPKVVFPKGQCKLSNIIFAAGENVTFESGASITVPAGQIVRFSGGFHSETNERIFFGSGAIVGIRQVRPSWWGQGIGSDLAALNAAQTCIAASTAGGVGRPTIWLSGDYVLTGTWTITPYATGCISVIGTGSFDGGTRFIAASTFPAAPVIAIAGNINPALNAVDMIISGFMVIPSGAGSGAATIGLQVGNPANGTKLEGFHCNVMEDILVQSFPICWQIIHSRLINFNRCSGWNILPSTNRVSLDITQNGGFTGDHRFTNCQFVANTGSGNISIRIISNTGVSTGSSGNMIAGIKFDGCDIYQADVKTRIFAGSGSWIADIWFDKCQWDGDSNTDIFMISTGTGSKIDDIHFANIYAAGGNLSANNQIYITGDTGGTVSDVHFNGGCLQLAQGRSMFINLVNGVTMDAVTIRDNNNQSGAAIEIVNSLRPVITGNRLNRITANFPKYFVSLGAGLNYVMVANNLGTSIAATATINDVSGGISKLVVNNL